MFNWVEHINLINTISFQIKMSVECGAAVPQSHIPIKGSEGEWMNVAKVSNNSPKKSQWWMRRFSNSGLFRRLYRTTSVLTAFDGLFNTRSILWLLVVLPLELMLLLFDRAPFVGWLAFVAPPLFVISDELVFWFWWWWTPLLPATAFEWIEPIACKLLWWACWCCCCCCDWFWWLYGGGGVILLWEF